MGYTESSDKDLCTKSLQGLVAKQVLGCETIVIAFCKNSWAPDNPARQSGETKAYKPQSQEASLGESGIIVRSFLHHLPTLCVGNFPRNGHVLFTVKRARAWVIIFLSILIGAFQTSLFPILVL